MPDNRSTMKDAIQEAVGALMDRVMERVLSEDPFVAEEHRVKKPLYAALVPDEIFRAAHFERRFVTPFGSVWEDIAVAAARHGLGFGEKQKRISAPIREQRLHRISEILNRLEHRGSSGLDVAPNWEQELEYVLEGTGEDVHTQVICDLFAKDADSKRRYAFELKAPLPNSDQTKVSKEKLLKLYAMDPCQIDEAYYALPYNPYGRREDYSWGFPARWFDMKNDRVVLIGDEFWEKIGGKRTYQAVIDAVNEIGEESRGRIYREYLGVDPPEESGNSGLS